MKIHENIAHLDKGGIESNSEYSNTEMGGGRGNHTTLV